MTQRSPKVACSIMIIIIIIIISISSKFALNLYVVVSQLFDRFTYYNA